MELDTKAEEGVPLQDLAQDHHGNGVGSPENPKLQVEDDSPYDPHLYRVVAHPTTNWETLVHILKGALGTGILAMPQAFYFAGYLSGFISTLLIGALATYCLHILVKMQYELCKRHRVPILTYPISMKMALEEGPPSLRRFSPSAIILVDGFMILYQLGICCVYIVFVAANIKKLVDVYIIEWDIKIHMVILLLPLLGLNCIKNLKVLAPFSAFANVITFIGIGMILYYILDKLPSPTEREAFGAIQNYPLFFGTTLFALEAVGVVIALENNMKTPKSFGGWFGVLNVGMFIITVLYAIVGYLGYIKYGPESEASITLNIPAREIMAQSITLIFAVAIFISYGLQGYVPVEIIWKQYVQPRIKDSSKQPQYELGIRFAVVIATFLLAISIPRLGLFISLFGALCLSALGIVFPAIMELCVKWPNFGPLKYIVWKDILLIIFGLIGLVAGTYTSLVGIIVSFQSPDEVATEAALNSTMIN